jgi:hypothetical protein
VENVGGSRALLVAAWVLVVLKWRVDPDATIAGLSVAGQFREPWVLIPKWDNSPGFAEAARVWRRTDLFRAQRDRRIDARRPVRR